MKKIYFSLFVFVVAFKTYAQPTCFSYTSTNYAGATNPWYAVIADFNNDGNKDFAANNFSGSSFNVYMGNGIGSFTQAAGSPYNTAGSNYGLTTADFNNDGNADIVVGCANYYRLYVGNGAGTFTTTGNVNFSGACSAYGAKAADFNNDGNMDLAFANGSVATPQILIGNGAGTFTAAPGSPYTLPGTEWWVENADFNKDGNMDLVFSNYTNSTCSVLLGTGTGSFAVQPAITGVAGAAQISVGDINNDTNLDFITSSGSAGTNLYTCLGNGSGGFSPATTMPTTGVAGPWGAALGDFNLDGNLDAFVCGYSANNSAVYYGNGSGGYTASTNSPFTIPGVTQNLHPAIGDLNGDNKVDVIVPGYGTTNHSVLLNKQINILGTSTICPGSSATFTASSVTSYSWSTGASTSTITVTPSVTTTYTVSGFFNGCSTTAVKTVTVSPLTVSIASSNSLICLGQTATLTASGASTYVWNTTATTAVIAVSPTVSTSYTVTGSSGICSSTTTILQQVSLCSGITNVNNPNFALSVFPNPSNGDFSVKSDIALDITIVNELGQEVKKISLNTSNNNQAQVSDLSSGIYFIIGTHDQQITRQRIVVTK